MKNILKFGLLTRFVMLFLFIFGIHAFTPTVALADTLALGLKFLCENGTIAKKADGSDAEFIANEYTSDDLTQKFICNGKYVNTWDNSYEPTVGAITNNDLWSFITYAASNTSQIDFTSSSYDGYATIKVTLDNQSATTAGTTEYYYKFNTYNGSCYYFSNSALTTCLAGAADGTKITIPTRTGYTFGGYYTGKNGAGTQYVDPDGKTVNNIYKAVDIPTTLYAKWTRNVYTITLDGNGATKAATPSKWYMVYGKGLCTTTTCANSDDYVTANKNPITKPELKYTVTFARNDGTSTTTSADAYATFNGFYNTRTSQNALNKMIANTGYVTSSGSSAAGKYTSNNTWYAGWTNDGTVTLPTPAARTGYTFNGWFTSATNGTRVGGAGANYTVSDNITLYAQWTAQTYTITLDDNGGSGGQGSVTVKYGEYPDTLTKLPTRNGHKFMGYAESYNEDNEEWKGQLYDEYGAAMYPYTTSGNTTLIAMWEAAPYTVTLNANGCDGFPKTIQIKAGEMISDVIAEPKTCTCGAFNGWYDTTEPDESSYEYRAGPWGSYGTPQVLYALTLDTGVGCDTGYYLPAATSSGLGGEGCEECPAGSFCPGVEPNVCSLSGSVGKAACGDGYTSAAGSYDASQCYINVPAGKYLDTAESSTFKDCPAGSKCPATKVYYGNIVLPQQCGAGYYSAENAGSCSQCGKGNFCSSGATAPQVCKDDTYSESSTASSCTSCTTGYEISGATAADHDNKSDCKITCAGGTYVKTAGGSCVKASIGYYITGQTVSEGTTQTPIQCPQDPTTSIYGTTANDGTSAATSCFITKTCNISGVTGTGKQSCNYNPSTGKYDSSCTQCVIDRCPEGQELVSGSCKPKIFNITLIDDRTGGNPEIVIKQVYNTEWRNSTNETITVAPIQTRSGYNFDGYYDAASGGNKVIGADGTLPSNTKYTADATLYVRWTPKTYVIKYKGHNSTTGENFDFGEQPCTVGQSCIVGEDVKSAITTGLTFSGVWTNDEISCGQPEFAQNDDLINYPTCAEKFADANNNELPVLKAHFRSNIYYIKYDANGGNGSVPDDANTECKYGVKCDLVANPFNKEGYSFLGWSKKSNPTANDVDFANNGYVPANASLTATNGEIVTLYAVWGTCEPCDKSSEGSYCTLYTSSGSCVYDSGCNSGYSKQATSTDYKPVCSVNKLRIPVYQLKQAMEENATPLTYVETYYNQPLPKLDLSKITRRGYTFDKMFGASYNQSDDDYQLVGGVFYDANGNPTDSPIRYTNLKLYATWIANSYMVELDPVKASKKGTGVLYYSFEQDERCKYYLDSTLNMCAENNKIESPARVAYSFRGYYTENDGKGNEYVDDEGTISDDLYTTVAENSILYADWEAVCTPVKLFVADGDTDLREEYVYMYPDSTTVYLDSDCDKSITELPITMRASMSNADFNGFYNRDGEMCVDTNWEFTGDCQLQYEDEDWEQQFECHTGYWSYGNDDSITYPSDPCTPLCYEIKLEYGAAGNLHYSSIYKSAAEKDQLYADVNCDVPLTTAHFEEMDHNPADGIANGALLEFRNEDGDVCLTSGGGGQLDYAECRVAGDTGWYAVYQCAPGYTANGDTVVADDECVENVYSVNLTYECGDFADGTAPEKPSTCSSNEPCTMPSADACGVYPGHTFKEWKIECEGCGENGKLYVQAGEDIHTEINATTSFLEPDWTVIAQWVPNCTPFKICATNDAGNKDCETVYQRADDLETVYGDDQCSPGNDHPMDALAGQMPNSKTPVGFYDDLTDTECVGSNLVNTGKCAVAANGSSTWVVKYQCKDGFAGPNGSKYAFAGEACSAPAITLNNAGATNEPIGTLYFNIDNSLFYKEATLTYQIASSDLPEKKYTVMYDAQGGTVSPTNETVQSAFGGYTVKIKNVEYEVIDSNGKLVSKNKSYLIQAIQQGMVATVKWASTPSVTLPTPADRSGYTFNGWNTKSDGTGIPYNADASYTPTASTTLYAQWDQCQTGTFEKGGKCVKCPSNSDSTEGATSCTCSDGYNYNGGTTTTTEACVENVTDTVYTIEYYCSIDGFSGEVEMSKQCYEGQDDCVNFVDPGCENDDYTYSNLYFEVDTTIKFAGTARTDDGSLMGILGGMADKNYNKNGITTVKVRPNWVASVTLNNQGADLGNGTEVFYIIDGKVYANREDTTQTLSQIELPKKTGNNFRGYYDKANCTGHWVVNSNGKIDTAYFADNKGNIELYACWNIDWREIWYYTYPDNDLPIDTFVQYGTEITIGKGWKTTDATEEKVVEIDERPGYTFTGWITEEGIEYKNGAKYIVKHTGVLELYATWEKNDYTIKYYDEETLINTTKYTVDNVGMTLYEPDAKDGYIFLGWNTQPDCESTYIYSITENNLDNYELYACWQTGKYTLTYELNGGEWAEGSNVANTVGYTIEDLPMELYVPEKPGYTFDGWYNNENFEGTAISEIVQPENITLYAKWDLTDYAITYILNGGTNHPENPETYTIKDKVMLKDPTYNGNGKLFLKWSDTEDCSGDAITGWFGSDAVNKTLYACWKDVIISIEYLCDGTNQIGETQKCSAFAEECTLNANICEGTVKGNYYNSYDIVGIDGSFGKDADLVETGFINYLLGDDDFWKADKPTLKLTPVWEPDTYGITLNNGEGVSNATIYSKYGVDKFYTNAQCNQTLPNNKVSVPNKDNYTFAGYSVYANSCENDRVVISSNGTINTEKLKTYADETYVSGDSVELYACWKPVSFEVYYNLNDTNNSGTYRNTVVAYNTEVQIGTIIRPDDGIVETLKPEFVGHEFMGWSTERNGNPDNTYEQGALYTIKGHTTFYAQWKVMTFTCKSGEYLNVLACEQCPKGHKCPQTQFTYDNNVQGRIACSGATEYQDQAGQTTCKTVSDGYYKTSDNKQQIVCGNGYYCKNGVRNQCPDNGLTDTATATDVTDCYKNNQSCTVSGGVGMSDVCYYDTTKSGYKNCDVCIINGCNSGYYKNGDACAICPQGSYCANSDINACPDNYTTADRGATKQSDCFTTCDDMAVEYGIAHADNAKVSAPAKCTYSRGESVTGNPCDIKNGKCVETSCKFDYEMKGGKCTECVRDNARSFKQGNGNCVVESCEFGYYPYGQSCVPATKECTTSSVYAIAAQKTWDTKTNSYTVCQITECADGYHISDNSCISDEKTCYVANGSGIQTWNHSLNRWNDECVVTQCNAGYTNDPSLTNETSVHCGRCTNAFDMNGDEAASLYIHGCEIATCKDQGKKYILENNECRTICDSKSDETGTRYWNGKECVHECNAGYLEW